MLKLFYIVFLFCCQLRTVAQDSTTDLTGNRKPFVLGVIDEIVSKELGERRTLNIYLPEGYAQEDTVRYPVIYLLDGSANEDFIHIAGLVQFNSFEWVHQVPKSIVVGIATVDRRRDFTFATTIEADRKKYPTTGHSDKFIAFIANELQPFIESRYRVSNDKTIIGQSLGGLFATQVLFTQPSLFNRYIIVSPALWWNNGSLLQKNAAHVVAAIHQSTAIYIGAGKEGLTPTVIPRIMETDAKELAKRISSFNNKQVKLYFDYLPNENHASILHQAVANAFKLLYPQAPL